MSITQQLQSPPLLITQRRTLILSAECRFLFVDEPLPLPMFTAIMSGRVGISGRQLLSCAEQVAIIYSQLNFFLNFVDII